MDLRERSINLKFKVKLRIDNKMKNEMIIIGGIKWEGDPYPPEHMDG